VMVVGATGALGLLVVKALVARGATVHALVRQGSKSTSVAQLGVNVINADFGSEEALTRALSGMACVVSTVNGLRDVIVDFQAHLLSAAIRAKVARFIPSDFSLDFRPLCDADNRNLAYRREFGRIADAHKDAIRVTTIFNGAFADLLKEKMPFIDFKHKTINYVESPDIGFEYTTYADTARFTAEVALDRNAPRYLSIAGCIANAHDLAAAVADVSGERFELKKQASLAFLQSLIFVFRNSRALLGVAVAGALALAGVNNERLSLPGDQTVWFGAAGVLGATSVATLALPYSVPTPLRAESGVFPAWQGMQYVENMVRVRTPGTDNNRYGPLQWTTVADVIREKLNAGRV